MTFFPQVLFRFVSFGRGYYCTAPSAFITGMRLTSFQLKTANIHKVICFRIRLTIHLHPMRQGFIRLKKKKTENCDYNQSINLHTHTRAHAHTHTHKHARAHTHTHTQTHTQHIKKKKQ